MIAARLGSVGCRAIIRDPLPKRVGLPLEFAGFSLLVWKLRFHVTTNGHEQRPVRQYLRRPNCMERGPALGPLFLRREGAPAPCFCASSSWTDSLTGKKPNDSVGQIYA